MHRTLSSLLLNRALPCGQNMASGASRQQQRPDLPWRARLLLSSFTFATDISCRPNFTVNRRLLNFLDSKCPPSQKPDSNGVRSFDVVVDSSRGLWFRLYAPPDTSDDFTFPLIVYFHGGGFFFLGANSKPLDEFCRRLAKELKAAVISVNYRLSSEHKWPSQYDDGFDVLKFIDHNPNLSGLVGSDLRLGVNLKHCFLAGDSAGGNLAHHVAVRAGEYDSFQSLDLIGLISIQPFFGGEERTASEVRLTRVPLVSVKRTDWAWKAFLPEGADRDHPAANVFGPNAAGELTSRVKYPATIVFVGGFDPLQDWQKRYCEGLRKMGKQVKLVEYPNAVHSFYVLPDLPEHSMFLEEVTGFMKQLAAAAD